MLTANTILKDLAHLFFPSICAGCGTDTISPDQMLCMHCQLRLNETSFANLKDNPVEKIFWGRLAVAKAMSQFYFTKDSLLQHLIHQLKYKGNKEIGVYLGELIGISLHASGRFSDIERIVPLPLFPEKEKKRGYNQATLICQGISQIMNLKVIPNAVSRTTYTETQTRKSRTERWQNVEEVFCVTQIKELENKSVLLVDDVITTGATLEACGLVMVRDIPGITLNICTLAYADK